MGQGERGTGSPGTWRGYGHSKWDFTGWKKKRNLVSLQPYETMMRIMALFLLLQGSQAGLFQRFIYGGVLPPPAVPLAFARGQGFPPQINREKTAPSHQSLKKESHNPQSFLKQLN
jgi:hypothetical protein